MGAGRSKNANLNQGPFPVFNPFALGGLNQFGPLNGLLNPLALASLGCNPLALAGLAGLGCGPCGLGCGINPVPIPIPFPVEVPIKIPIPQPVPVEVPVPQPFPVEIPVPVEVFKLFSFIKNIDFSYWI